MLRRTVMAAVMAVTAGAVGITSVEPSWALPVAPSQTEATGVSDGLQFAAYRKKVVIRRRGGHVSRFVYTARFGPRYRYRYGRYIYGYGGWFYARPWWTLHTGYYHRGYYGCRKVVRITNYRHRHVKVVRRVCY